MVEVVFSNALEYEHIKGMKKVDMHCHTDVSDGKNTAEELIKQAKKLNIGLSITDHNEISSSLKACKELPFAIPGIELTSSDAIDFLAYFYDAKDLENFYNKHIKGNHLSTRVFNLRKLKWNTVELLEDLRKHNCLVVLPHPLTLRPKNSFVYMEKNPKLIKYIHGIEVINSVIRHELNERTVLWAKEIKKGATGASDAHNVKYLGMALTASHAETTEDFLDNIVKKNNVVVGKSLVMIKKLHVSIGILRRNLSW